MTKRVLGVLAALSMVVGSVACSSSSDGGGGVPTTDSGKTDSATDAKTDGPKPVTDGAMGETGPTEDKVGQTCMTDDDCDLSGAGTTFCSKAGFSSGPLNPDPVCIGTSCDAGDGTKIMSCGQDTGVCLSTSSSTICLPACDFDDTGAAPKGCLGKDACNVYGWGTDTTKMPATVVGVGYCFGGCKADADCPSGSSCQTEDGLCVKTKVAYTKTVGTACTKDDASKNCNCLYSTKTNAGYCSQFCKVGDAGACPSGFTCDTELPKTPIKMGDTVFTKAPTGMAGSCLKNCTADADCASLGAYCDESAGTGTKTCHIGKRPCATDANCPTGTTCMGATSSALGSCG